MLIEGSAGGKGVLDESVPIASGPLAGVGEQEIRNPLPSSVWEIPLLLLFRPWEGATKVSQLFFALSRSMW
jgi:hypothetical protein